MWPSNWCLTAVGDPPSLFFLYGVMWMSKITSLPTPLSKTHDRATTWHMYPWVFLSIAMSLQAVCWLYYDTEAEILDATAERLSRFCFATRATCWQQRWKTPPCWLIHLSIPQLCAEGMNFPFASMWRKADWWKIYYRIVGLAAATEQFGGLCHGSRAHQILKHCCQA